MKHVLFTLYDCDPDLLNDRMFIEGLLYDAAEASGATFLNTISHQFEPQGVTAVTLLAESHISIHTWPEEGKAVCDIFTCGQADPMLGFAVMRSRLGAKSSVHKQYDRPFAFN